MKKLKFLSSFLLLLYPAVICAQKEKVFEVKSPDGAIVVKVESGAKMSWSVEHKGQQIIVPSAISLLLQNGEVLGDNASVTSSKTISVNTTFNPVNYRKT
jgi:alpha-glucosidase